ncbi:hypothetical protein D6855_08590 [Butyrivibrio sp. CB08]|uniref:hypothetical protein n=1 Tax=Butyrivibrio sp. CB08 TaxID=2364879 RepID=UPI000EAA4A66|nr:hypothetical protein [Butyrivibrio sp. CB08]RKM59833.1 hypothetical protein D6855_08590 [Butyrivibrio sp. CB08]
MRTIDDFFDTKITIFGVSFRMLDLFFGIVMLGLGIAVRYSLYDFESGDYSFFLSTWMQECHEAGGLPYLGITPGLSDASTINYGCMYQYVIVILHYIGGNDLHLLKSVSVIFDMICAATIFRITYLVTDGSVKKSLMAFGAVMFLPTCVLNSGAWAQCDSLYTAFALLAIYHLMKGNNARFFIYLALSYSFKQQAIFIIPFAIILWLKGKVKLRYIFLSPIVFFITLIPALIMGRELNELLSVYTKQVVKYSRLSMNYPNIYSFVGEGLSKDSRLQIISCGTVCCILLLGMVAYYIRDQKFELTNIYMVTLAIFTVLLCLYALPVMHERYGFIAEMLLVVYGITSYRRMGICAVVQAVSVITYSRFLYGSTVTVLWPLALINLAILLMVGYDLFLQMKRVEAENG